MSPVETEQRLLAFGPFGVSTCDGPYGVFRWQKQNVTAIELTDRAIRGMETRGLLRAFGGRGKRVPAFDIPYAAIVSVRLAPHPAQLGLMHVLSITYEENGQTRERSIAAYNDPARRAFAILSRYAPASS